MMKWFFAASFVYLGSIYDKSSAAEMSLDQYLEQVRNSHEGMKANQTLMSAQLDRSKEAELVTSSNFFLNAQNFYDEKFNSQPGRGSKVESNGLTFGVSKITDFGLSGKISYSLSKTNLPDAKKNLIPEPKYFDTATTIELNQSLLKNGDGSDIKNTKSLQVAQTEMNYQIEKMKYRVSLAEAEAAYWRLVLARETIKFQKENLKRAEALVSWLQNKVSAKLADSSELVQTQAILELRKLELQGGIDEEKAAMRAFNTARNIDSGEVAESLTRMTSELVAGLKIPNAGVRPDVAAAEQAAKLAKASADLGRDKFKSSFDVFASYAFNGHDEKVGKAIGQGFTPENPTRIVGVKLTVPLDNTNVRTAREGYGKEAVAAEYNASRKSFEASREWDELVRRVGEVKNRLKLVDKMEELQRKKLEMERKKQKLGRSVLFQVIQYETDLISAQLNIIRTKGELLSLVARMKIFGAEK